MSDTIDAIKGILKAQDESAGSADGLSGGGNQSEPNQAKTMNLEEANDEMRQETLNDRQEGEEDEGEFRGQDFEADETDEKDAVTDQGQDTQLAEVAALLGVDPETVVYDEAAGKVKIRFVGEDGVERLLDPAQVIKQAVIPEAKETTPDEQTPTEEADGTLQRLAQAEQLLQTATQQLQKEIEAIDWDELRKTDPDAYMAKQREIQEQQTQLAELAQRFQQEVAEYQRQKQQQELETLYSLIPEWRDTTTRIREAAELRGWLVEQGLTEQDLSAIQSARMLKLMRDAMAYNELQKKAETKKPVKALRKVRPKTRNERKAATADRLRKELRQRGDIATAAEYLKTLKL